MHIISTVLDKIEMTLMNRNFASLWIFRNYFRNRKHRLSYPLPLLIFSCLMYKKGNHISETYTFLLHTK